MHQQFVRMLDIYLLMNALSLPGCLWIFSATGCVWTQELWAAESWTMFSSLLVWYFYMLQISSHWEVMPRCVKGTSHSFQTGFRSMAKDLASKANEADFYLLSHFLRSLCLCPSSVLKHLSYIILPQIGLSKFLTIPGGSMNKISRVIATAIAYFRRVYTR